eukprot:gene23947-8787_t
MSFEFQWSSTDGLVCEKLGLTGGAPLFSFQYTDKKANETFLKLDKKVLSQDLNKKEVPKQLSFKAKFFPESVGDELLDPVMQRLFWKQIRAGIVEDTIYCPPELCVLFAAQAVQFEHGDFAPENAGKVVASAELPERVINQHGLTAEAWAERIVNAWQGQRGVSKEACVMDYLNIAQDLE